MDIKKYILTLIAMLFLIAPVKADYLYDFSYVSGDVQGIPVQNQITLEVTSSGGGINFTYTNAAGGLSSSLTTIYVDDDDVLGEITSLLDSSSGVKFEIDNVEPSVFTGSGSLGFDVEELLSASDVKEPSVGTSNGVNPGEYLTISYSYAEKDGGGFYDFSDVINAINNEDLRIGIKVKSICIDGVGDYSTEFILVPVPLPATVLLGLLGLGVGGWKMRKSTVKNH